MAIWEYKVISSGKGGFATPQLLENFLNQLGKDEWEIINYRPAPDNALAFTGLARRGTQRDWTLEAAAAAQAKADEEKRRIEERAEQLARESAAERNAAKPSSGDAAAASGHPDEPRRDERLRTLRDTERDDDPEALAEEAEAGDELADWDEMSLDDDLPSLFDAIKPHLRRNPKGLGEAAALDYLARRWEQEPEDVLGALKECGLTVPANEDDAPEYFDFEGDLYWLNCNNRGQLFINVREKPRPRFKPTQMRKLDPADPASEELRAEYEGEQEKKRAAQAERDAREAERVARRAAAEAEANKPAPPLPQGPELFEIIKPRMRRNRRGPGMSGTVAFLAKALKQTDEAVLAALAAVGLTLSDNDEDKPAFVEDDGQLYWLKKDGRGGVWINSRDKDKGRHKDGNAHDENADAGDRGDADEPAGSTADAGSDDRSSPDRASESENESENENDQAGDQEEDKVVDVKFEPGAKALPALRLLLKSKPRGVGASAEIGSLSRKLNKPAVEILEALVKAGLNVPDDADEKPRFAELGDEILWLNRNAKDDSLWLNAKAKPKRSRSRPAKKRSGDQSADADDSSPADDAGGED